MSENETEAAKPRWSASTGVRSQLPNLEQHMEQRITAPTNQSKPSQTKPNQVKTEH